MLRARILATVAAAALCSAAGAARAGGANEAFRALAAGFLEAYHAAHPVNATQLGIHRHDAELDDLRPRARQRRVDDLLGWLARLGAIDRDRLTGAAFYDHRILEHAIRAELLELQHVRGWRHDPMLYNRLLAGAVASLIDRRFADLETRLASAISRLERYPRLIRAARRNLDDVPRAWAELAVRNTRGTGRFLRESVPAALADQGIDSLDPALRKRWHRALAQGAARVERFADWLERDLLPRADGDYRLGRELFERKLFYEEHVDLDVDELERRNEAAITRYRAWVADEAARYDPSLDPTEAMRRITEEHPSPDELIPIARRYVEQARDLVLERGIVTLPTEALPIVRPTPEYARTGFASMSTPGPFETSATEAYYNITNVDPAWTAEQQHQHLTYFNYPGLLGISVHEAMPGHYVHFLYKRQLPTDVRKVFTPASLSEGWAHYAEQMMVDEGLGDGAPAARLGQLRRALQRHARWYAGIALHTTDRSVEDVAERFAEIAYFAPFPAYRETLRGTYNPTYLYYALGRMQIFELREEYRQRRLDRGQRFSLREFHDRLLSLGLPLPLAREALLND